MKGGPYRRDVLKGLGGLGIGSAVAGSTVLSGDAIANHETEVVPADVAFSNWINDDPYDLHFNRYNLTNQTEFAHRLVFEPTVKWSYANEEFQYWGITDWEMVDDTTFEFSVNTDITWSDGDALTSQDVATQLRLSRVNGAEIWDFVDSVDTPDDSTVRLNLPDGGNPQILKICLAETYLHTKHSEFEQYLDGVGDDADETVANELQGSEIREPVTNGPFCSVESAEGVGIKSLCRRFRSAVGRNLRWNLGRKGADRVYGVDRFNFSTTKSEIITPSEIVIPVPSSDSTEQ